jgi:hypothetical protein
MKTSRTENFLDTSVSTVIKPIKKEMGLRKLRSQGLFRWKVHKDLRSVISDKGLKYVEVTSSNLDDSGELLRELK